MEVHVSPFTCQRGNAQLKPQRSISFNIVNESLQGPLFPPKAYNKPSEFLESIAIEDPKGKGDGNADFTFNPQGRRKKFRSIFDEKDLALKKNHQSNFLEYLNSNKENIPNLNEEQFQHTKFTWKA